MRLDSSYVFILISEDEEASRSQGVLGKPDLQREFQVNKGNTHASIRTHVHTYLILNIMN